MSLLVYCHLRCRSKILHRQVFLAKIHTTVLARWMWRTKKIAWEKISLKQFILIISVISNVPCAMVVHSIDNFTQNHDI